MVQHPSEPWAPTLPIVTARLNLRVHRSTDLEELLVYHGDPDTTRYLPWPVRTRQQTADALVPKLSQGVARAEGDWLVLAIEERASGTVIGEVLLKRGPGTTCELGYVIRRDRHGLGLASEAVAAMLTLAFDEYGQTAVDAEIQRGNAASVRLVERFGFVRDESLHYLKDGVQIDGYVLRRS
jgi:RimJ/RimL family protein N-acetyltransferase